MADDPVHDIFVIGGGINGVGVARDAAGRGYSVLLAEMHDLASGTSSWSTKLIHGGLRYLEYYEFRLVREALMEREVLWRMAPHIIWPLRFVLPYHAGLRPYWLLRLGLFLYDHIGGRKELPPTRVIDMRSDPAGKPLKPLFRRAFEYSDCWVNDARLVVLNARDAAERGAAIRTRTKVVKARAQDGVWTIQMRDERTESTQSVRARMLVNAAGPWVDRVLSSTLGRSAGHNVRLVKGSHIVVRRKYDDPRAYFFQNRDDRIIFAIPYEEDFTLIGTTDEDFEGEPGAAAIDADEVAYLCAAASEYFAEPVRPDDIVWSYSGVRPLFDDGASKAQEATRDYVLKEDDETHGAPLVSVFGGKITTHRKLSEAVLDMIGEKIGRKGAPWTADSRLPGGDFDHTAFEREVSALAHDYPFLERSHARRLARLYGTRARDMLGSAKEADDLGRCFGDDLYETEVRYLCAHEWARSAEDILWRRTKRGLKLAPDQVSDLEAFVAGLAPASM